MGRQRTQRHILKGPFVIEYHEGMGKEGTVRKTDLIPQDFIETQGKALDSKILYYTFQNICLHNDKCINKKSMELLQIQIKKWLNYMCTL